VAVAVAEALAAAVPAMDNNDSIEWWRWWGVLMAAKVFDSI
jgi:hypothetical protein